MAMTIQYYTESVAQSIGTRETPLEVSNSAYMGAGAVGFAYLNGIIGPAEWTKLSDKITDAAVKRIKELDAKSRDNCLREELAH